MPRTTKKHRDFVYEPMGDKPVTDLPGVGDVLGKRLQTAGYAKANEVLAQFLQLKMKKESFQGWMNDTCNADNRESAACYQGLKAWCDEFMY